MQLVFYRVIRCIAYSSAAIVRNVKHMAMKIEQNHKKASSWILSDGITNIDPLRSIEMQAQRLLHYSVTLYITIVVIYATTAASFK